jgi:hypothetical protein
MLRNLSCQTLMRNPASSYLSLAVRPATWVPEHYRSVCRISYGVRYGKDIFISLSLMVHSLFSFLHMDEGFHT